jgi:excisionase family DNA binding protein
MDGMNQMKKPGIQRQTLSIDEAAEYLGVGRTSLQSYIASGLIPVVKWPGQRRQRLSIAALDKFRQSCEGTAGEINVVDSPTDRASKKKDRSAELDAVFERKH